MSILKSCKVRFWILIDNNKWKSVGFFTKYDNKEELRQSVMSNFSNYTIRDLIIVDLKDEE